MGSYDRDNKRKKDHSQNGEDWTEKRLIMAGQFSVNMISQSAKS